MNKTVIVKSFSTASEEEKKTSYWVYFKYFFAVYFASYVILAGSGEYHDHSPEGYGNSYWVYTPALMTHHLNSHRGDMDIPSVAGIFYLPLLIIDSWFFKWMHHRTLIASDMAGDGHTYEYPERGITFEKNGS